MVVCVCLLNPGSGKSDTILANIKLGVVHPNEHVPQDPEGTYLGIETHEPTHTHRLATCVFLEHIFISRELQGLSIDCESHVG